MCSGSVPGVLQIHSGLVPGVFQTRSGCDLDLFWVCSCSICPSLQGHSSPAPIQPTEALKSEKDFVWESFKTIWVSGFVLDFIPFQVLDVIADSLVLGVL